MLGVAVVSAIFMLSDNIYSCIWTNTAHVGLQSQVVLKSMWFDIIFVAVLIWHDDISEQLSHCLHFVCVFICAITNSITLCLPPCC